MYRSQNKLRKARRSRQASFEPLEDRRLMAGITGLDFASYAPVAVAEGESANTTSGTSGNLPQSYDADLDRDVKYLPGHLFQQKTGDFLSRPASGTPLQIARSYLSARGHELGLTASDLNNYVVKDQYTDADTGVTHIYLKQTYNGLEITNADLSINLTRDGRVINVGSTFVTGLTYPSTPSDLTPAVSPVQAYQSLAGKLGYSFTSTPSVVNPPVGRNQQTVISAGGVATANVPAKLQYVATENGLQLVWNLVVPTVDREHWYDANVSSQNGTPLYVSDWVDAATYNVYGLPNDDPSKGARVTVINPQDAVASPYGWHDVNGLPGPDFFDTRGNNVFAQQDRDGVGATTGTPVVTSRPSGGPNLDFNYPINLTQQPQFYTDASVVNLFYFANIAHDVTFRYGFNEQSGNFQSNNYTKLGKPGDPVLAFAQSGDALAVPLNNAFFATPPDGFQPLMVMGTLDTDLSDLNNGNFNTYNPRRDASLVGGIVFHEFFHGVTNRLTGGANNVNALNALQSRAMGEGWSDYYYLFQTQSPLQTANTPVAVADYVNGPNPLFDAKGIRRFAYSYDMTINPLTFGDYNSGGGLVPNFEEHNAGEIWASALWDMQWNLINKYGYSTDLYNGKGGNNVAMQLVMDGLKLQPANPTFLNARDAILTADLIRNKGVNFDAIWSAFARRGFGYSADSDILDLGTQPGTGTPVVFVDSPNSTDVREAFDLPPGSSSSHLRGTVFTDVNGNGVQDVGDAGIPNWTLYLDINENGRYDALEPTDKTDTNGDYEFTLYVPGQFTVSSIIPSGFGQTFPPSNGSHTVTVVPGQDINNLDFGYRSSGSTAGGIKWNDLNGDGVKDDNEPGIAGVSIYVDLDADGRLDMGEPSSVTGPDGRYSLVLDRVGTYAVREVIPPGWEQTFPGVDNPHMVTLTTGSLAINVNFANKGILDYGDAPDSYKTLSASSGAVHGILAGFYLGSQVDAEINGQPSNDARGDDNAGLDDDDGVVFANDLAAGTQATVSVNVHTGGFSMGKLQGWVDFNQDGDWNDAGEQVFTNLRLANGTHSLNFAVPSTALSGVTYARFRYGYETDLKSFGPSMAGEVEDYVVRVLDNKPDARNDQFSVVQNSIGNRLDVLGNDIPSALGPLTITNVTTPDRGGSISITTDLKELRYTPRPGFFGVETFTYTVTDGKGNFDTASVAVTVLPAFEDPIAVDDSYSVNQGSSSNVLDVLTNDLPGRNGPISIISFTQPDNGQITLDNRGTVTDTSDDVLRYRPNSTFGGTDQFSYTIENSLGVQDTAQVTVNVLPRSLDNDKVQIRLETTDLNGNPIQAISQGEQFLLKAYVKDLRSDDEVDDGIDRRGVYAAYFDLLYNYRLVSTVGTVDFDGPYTNFPSSDLDIPGLIDEVGAFQQGNDPLGDEEVPLFSVIMAANGFGVANFVGDPADIRPDHDTLLYEPPSPALDPVEIRFVNTEIVVVGAGGIPTAIDNTYSVAANSTNNLLDVLKNDQETDNPPLAITAVSAPNNGGTVSIGTNGADLRYTPRAGFNGTEQFTYTVRNSIGLTDTATVTVQVGTSPKDVRVRLETTDTNGSPITSVPKGGQFQLRAYIKDVRTAPPADAGVFASYFDLLYDAGLTSTVASTDTNNYPFGIVMDFADPYLFGKSADASTVGLVDETGAFQTSFTPLGTTERLLYSVTFTADEQGTATFAADPADVLPQHDTLLFEPDDQGVPIPRILYGSTSITIGTGGSTVGTPVAVDNFFSVNANTTNNSLTVLGNDIANDPAGLSVVTVGSTSNGGTVSIAAGGGSLIYTPRANFTGIDQFTYTARNSGGLTSTARVSVQVGTSAKDVNFRVQTTDLNGNPISSVAAGSEYFVQLLVQDSRPPAVDSGVYAAYSDLLYNASLTSVITASNPFGFAITHSPPYENGASGDAVTPGLINEAGAFEKGLTPLGNDEYLLFQVRMKANTAGTVTFQADPADVTPLHDTLLFNTPSSAVSVQRIAFGQTTLTITGAEGEFTNVRNRFDVNNDGFTTAMDALQVIMTINTKGSRQLTPGDLTAAEGETTPNAATAATRRYYDVNGDGYVSPMDVIQVIDAINGTNAASASPEGEVAGGNTTTRAAASLVQTAPATNSSTSSSSTSQSTSSTARPAATTAPSSQAVDSVLSQIGATSTNSTSNRRLLLLARGRGTASSANVDEVLTSDLAADVGSAWSSRRSS